MAYISEFDDLHSGTTLKAAGLVAADTNETGVFIGRGWFIVRIATTAVEIASNDELFNIYLEANTIAADTTWDQLGGNVVLGATEVTGGQPDSTDAGTYDICVFNPHDHQVRIVTKVNGTIASGINFTATAYSLPAQGTY